jgi:hypothetical protein
MQHADYSFLSNPTISSCFFAKMPEKKQEKAHPLRHAISS